MRYVGLTWIAFTLPMMLAFVGGYLADRYNRWALMFVGYTISALCYVIYGSTTNLTLFLFVSVVEGLAVAWSYPAKQAFFVQVVPPRWLGSLQGMESSAVQVAALIGTLVAPLLFSVHVRLRDQPGRARLARRAVLRRRLSSIGSGGGSGRQEKRPRRGWPLFPWRSDSVYNRS